eukprot:4405914-Amphidinium_carterae.1
MFIDIDEYVPSQFTSAEGDGCVQRAQITVTSKKGGKTHSPQSTQNIKRVRRVPFAEVGSLFLITRITPFLPPDARDSEFCSTHSVLTKSYQTCQRQSMPPE